MVLVAARFNAVVLFLMILRLMLLPFCVLSLFCYTFLSVLSSFAVILTRKRELIVFLMPCDCWCSVGLPHGAVGWSTVCDCGIS